MKIFHGGCHGCTNQDFYDLAECLDCQYYDFNAFSNKPNNFSDAEIRKVYDPVSHKYYALKSDEKLVHVHRGYALDENGEPFQPLVTEIAKLTEDNSLKMSEEIEYTDLHYRGEKIRLASHKSMVVHDNSGSVSEWVEPVKEFGLVDELQKETDEWLVGVV